MMAHSTPSHRPAASSSPQTLFGVGETLAHSIGNVDAGADCNPRLRTLYPPGSIVHARNVRTDKECEDLCNGDAACAYWQVGLRTQ